MRASKVVCIGLVALLAVLAAACGGGSGAGGDQSNGNGEGSGNKKLGMAVLNLSNPFFVEMSNAAKEEARAQGYELQVVDPKDDVNEQVTALENFRSQNVAAVIVTAADQKVLNQKVGNITESGIPVIAHTTKLENASAWVGADEYKMGITLGEQAGRWIDEAHGGKGKVGILNYDQIEQVKQRKKGIVDGIRKHASEVEVAGDQQAGDPTAGLEVAEGFLQANPDMIGIFGINDGGALGAYNAAKAANKDPEEFAVGGIDAVPEAIEAIKEGDLYKFTVSQQPKLTGRTLVQTAIKAANGEDVPQEKEIPVEPVNESNVSEY